MTITVNNQQVEAYDLLMKKEFALEILQGKKKVEFRSFTDHYISRFLDKDKAAANKAKGQPTLDDLSNEIREDVQYIHFHNYNNTWYLDVAIDGIGYCFVDSMDIEPLAEQFDDFKAYLDDARKNDELPEEEKPMMFYIVLAEIVGTNLN